MTVHYSDDAVTIHHGNALALPVEDASVDLVVTSPPYFGLRSYTDGGEHYEGQIGAEASPAEFVDALIAATAEMVRVLKPSGSIWVNLGDKYAGNTNGTGAHRALSRVGGGQARTVTGAPTKSLIGIPWRYALRCIDDLGLILRAEVIWSKPNGLPESVTDRVRRSHETWFHLVKQPRYFSAVDEVREGYAPETAARYALGYQRNGRTEHGQQTTPSIPVGVDGLTINPLGKLPGSVWDIPTQPLRVPDHLGVDHFAAFPMEWPRRIIRGWSPSGICVECGEGRRPVAGDTGADYGQQYANHRRAAQLIDEHGFDRARLRALGPSKWERWKAGGAMGGSFTAAEVELCERLHALLKGYAECAIVVCASTVKAITGEACACPEPTAPTRPAVVLDPFGGTGTTALVARALGRRAIHVDLSHDYCRLAQWRVTDPGEIARAMQVDKPPAPPQAESLLDLLEPA